MLVPIRRRGLGRPGGLPIVVAELALPPQAHVSELAVQRLGAVAERMTRFTTSEILDHAIGIGAIRHCNEIELILERLTVLGVITPCATGAAMWTTTSEAAT